MAPQSRGHRAQSSLSRSAPDLLTLDGFQSSNNQAISPDEPTPRAAQINNGLIPLPNRHSNADPNSIPLSSPEDAKSVEDEEEESDSDDFQSHYSLNQSSDSNSDSDDVGDVGNGIGDGYEKRSSSTSALPTTRPFLHHSNSSYLLANAFAPPFYNRPPTPLPPSPSLTSLLRPSFSTTTSRPTTPDSSENDTEDAVVKSARTATTVPRASPKVPTYEYYGFVLYLVSTLGFCKFLIHLAIVRSFSNTRRKAPALN
ncbi:hypothetical protein MMC09_001784 [Bachmanniomyces sp. S44760]|nr:hypothetical protein [Bachmanniomyces sp. S44760]